MGSIDVEDIKAFLVESYENLNQIEQDIMSLEKTSNYEAALVHIYRSLHTLKGNCGFLPFPTLEAIVHAGENVVSQLRDRRLLINAEIVNTLLQTVDAIRYLLAQIESTSDEGDRDYSRLLQALATVQVLEPATLKESELLYDPSETANSNGAMIYSSSPSSDATIRVDVSLLDRLMDLVGELVLARNQMTQFSTQFSAVFNASTFKNTTFNNTFSNSKFSNSKFNASCQRLDWITTELQEGVMKTRMQPISTVWQKFSRFVRDLAAAHGKQVHVEMEGAETELDKTILEAIRDPLTHLVRNCIDHGIETADVRIAQGKASVGRLLLRAFHEGGKVTIEIRDDGRGIDPERLKQRAERVGLITPSQAVDMSEADAINLIFLPGFSTAEQVTNLSGRGVGMDVVRSNIEKINGTIEVDSQIGLGTTFKIKIPLTLAIISVLVVSSGGNFYAIPQVSLQELVRLDRQQALSHIETLYNVPVYRLRGTLLPLIYLNQELHAEDTAANDDTISIIVINTDEYRFGLVVDNIEDTQDIVVKSLGNQLKAVSTFVGATVLGDGAIALILDAVGLANHAGITPQIQRQLTHYSNAHTAKQDAVEDTDRQMILLFEAAHGARMGIPLSIALRLEKVDPSAVEKAGTQWVVQYRNEILPLINLQSIFAGEEQDLAQSADDDLLHLVVISLDGKHNIGLVIERVIDIVEESLTIRGTASRLGVLFYAAVQGQATEILDVESIIRMVNPHFLQLSH
jgi:two-component system chemotaxis sensor kinase CheA